MTNDQIEDLRNALSDVLHNYAYPTEDGKIIAECKALLNTLLDYTARVQGYSDYFEELLTVRAEVSNWKAKEVVFTPHPTK